jgi:hypothetical protein
MKHIFIKIQNLFMFAVAIIILLIVFSAASAYPNQVEEKLYSLNIYAGQMTTNDWEDFFGFGDQMNFTNSYLAAVTLARRIGTYKKMASFEVEGQVVKHFNIQDHWELNALVIARWDAFWWDKYIDTSVAFGLGPSFATAEPVIEKLSEGHTSKFLVYWMMELEFGLPEYSSFSLVTRLHHRSNAYGLLAEKGGSNALAIGLKYRF